MQTRRRRKKEMEEITWRYYRKYIFGREEEEPRGKRSQIFGERKYISEEKKSREGRKRRKIFGDGKYIFGGRE